MNRVTTGLWAFLLVVCLCFPVSAEIDGVKELKVKASFSDVEQDLADAIINRGYTIDHKSFTGDMLKRTGPSVGSEKVIYKDAQLVQFCSAVLSRKMMEADPANIAFCPYVIFYYERADEPGTVHIGFRRMSEQGSDESKAAIKAINDLLNEVIEEVAGG